MPIPDSGELEEQTSLLSPGNHHSTADDAGVDGHKPNGAPAKDDRGNVVGAAARWRSTAVRVLIAKRFHDAIGAAVERHAPGAAPGVDPRRNKYHHLAAKWSLPVKITVVDYDSQEMTQHPEITSAQRLEELLSRPRGEGPRGLPRVRWIHVDGLNWDVVQVLALKYDLHPLALEDTVHVPQRVKADFYDSCLYVSLIYLYLAQGVQQTDNDGDGSEDGGGSESPQPPAPRRAYDDHGATAAMAGDGGGELYGSCGMQPGMHRGPAAGRSFRSLPPRTLSSARRAAAVEAATTALDTESGVAQYDRPYAGRSSRSLTAAVAAAGGKDVERDGAAGVSYNTAARGNAASATRSTSAVLAGGGSTAGPLDQTPGTGSGAAAASAAVGLRSRSPGPEHYPLPLRHGSVTLRSDTWQGGNTAGASGGAAAAVAGPAGPARQQTGARGRLGENDGGGPLGRCFSFFGRRTWSSQPSSGGGSGGGGGRRATRRVREERAVHVSVSAQQVSLFLLRGEAANTLITVFQSDGSAVVEPILEQLREPRTLVREAEDASFLANLVIDTLVDHIFPVVGAYREQLLQYEAELLAPRGGRPTGPGRPAGHSARGLQRRPTAACVGELHAMQRDLRRLDRTLAPLQVVVSNMVVRDATGRGACGPDGGALSRIPSYNAAAGGGAAFGGPGLPPQAAAPLPAAPQSFLSPLTRTYLGDVRDHVATLCEDLISLSAECGDLIGLLFNLTALQQSQSTQTLSVVSTIFLPITFLAGVYGMNFDTLPELHWTYGYLYFWSTSLVIVVVFLAVMMRAGML